MVGSAGGSDLFLLDSDGTGLRRLTETRRPESDPAWSPDGGKIAFVRHTSGVEGYRDLGAEIYVLDLATGREVNVSRHEADDLGPVWSPDAEWLAFTSDRDEDEEVYAVRADGTDLTRLTNSPASDVAVAWRPGAIPLETLLETAATPPSGIGGTSVFDRQWLGARFTLTETMRVEFVGGYFGFGGTLFAAVIDLPAPDGLPADPDPDLPREARLFAVFETPLLGEGMAGAHTDVVLPPGAYGLVFGANSAWGATGGGFMPLGRPLVDPSFFVWEPSHAPAWRDISDLTGGAFRFVIQGRPAAPDS